jgi:molecular chaperone GrpE
VRPTVGFSAPLFMKKHDTSPEERVSGNQCGCHDCISEPKEAKVRGEKALEDTQPSPPADESKSEVKTVSPNEECGEESSIDGEIEVIEGSEDVLEHGAKARNVEQEALQAEIIRLQEREEELNQRLTRLQADFDNFRKRNRKELQEGITRANEELIGQLLPVLDNFDRALAARDNACVDSLRDGLELVHRQFLDILAKEGLQPIKAVGETFDPNIHEAVMVEEVDEPKMDNQIIQQLQKGYSFRERLLRAAVVKVAKVSD